MIRSKPSLVLAPLLLALSSPASALQILDARDGETVLARIAQKEVTRIAFERSRIRKVTGNAGEFVLEKDEDKGVKVKSGVWNVLGMG
jgi:conjugal transfer pilus assembly protein TraK